MATLAHYRTLWFLLSEFHQLSNIFLFFNVPKPFLLLPACTFHVACLPMIDGISGNLKRDSWALKEDGVGGGQKREQWDGKTRHVSVPVVQDFGIICHFLTPSLALTGRGSSNLWRMTNLPLVMNETPPPECQEGADGEDGCHPGNTEIIWWMALQAGRPLSGPSKCIQLERISLKRLFIVLFPHL